MQIVDTLDSVWDGYVTFRKQNKSDEKKVFWNINQY